MADKPTGLQVRLLRIQDFTTDKVTTETNSTFLEWTMTFLTHTSDRVNILIKVKFILFKQPVNTVDFSDLRRHENVLWNNVGILLHSTYYKTLYSFWISLLKQLLKNTWQTCHCFVPLKYFIFYTCPKLRGLFPEKWRDRETKITFR